MMIVNAERELLEKIARKHYGGQHETEVTSENTILHNDGNKNSACDDDKMEEDSSDILDSHSDGGNCGDDLNNTPEVDSELKFMARFADSAPKPLPTRRSLYAVCPQYVRHLDKLKDFPITTNLIKKLLEYTKNKIVNTEKKKYNKTFITSRHGNVLNIATLLEHSNIIPFKTRVRSGFTCFYCPAVFEDGSLLREHTLGHTKTDAVSILRCYVPDRLAVNADVAGLACAVCNTTIKNIDELKIHLKKVHGKTLYPEFKDRLIPFTLSDVNVCIHCGCAFETFAALERHMNVHYRNYVCKECGMGFVTPNRLNVHASNSHGRDAYPCRECGKVFRGRAKHRTHVAVVHGKLKRFKCVKCILRFSEHIERQKHMTTEHGVTPIVYKCNVCEKSFDRRYLLSRHLKKHHLDERAFECHVCPYKFYSSSELKSHMVRHTGEKKFECSVCGKVFARKRTLIEHMRIHNNDRRFACSLCDQAFVQNSSLKCHVKNHHAG